MTLLCPYNVLMREGGTFCCDGVPASALMPTVEGRPVCGAWVPAEHYCGSYLDCDDCGTDKCGPVACGKYAKVIAKNGYCAGIEASKKIATGAPW